MLRFHCPLAYAKLALCFTHGFAFQLLDMRIKSCVSLFSRQKLVSRDYFLMYVSA